MIGTRTILQNLLIALAVFLIAGGALQGEERWPSSELLMPCFEIGFDDPRLNSVFAVVNSGDRPIPVRLSVLSDWGVAVLETELVIGPRAVQPVNLADWILNGKDPSGVTLDPAFCVEVQHALCGVEALLPQLSPDPGYYSYLDQVPLPERGIGSVVITALDKDAAEVLWGDFFMFDLAKNIADGEVLANLDPEIAMDDTDEDDLCTIHALRFLEGGAFDGTELMLWNPRRGERLDQPLFPEENKVPAIISIYDEQGVFLGERRRELEPLEWIPVEEEILPPLPNKFGWLKIDTGEIDTFITTRYSAFGNFSAAMETFCLPKGTGEGPAIDIEKSTNGVDADHYPGVHVDMGAPVVWRYVVTNIGSVPLTNIIVTDLIPAIDDVLVCEDVDILLPGESMSCEATGTASVCHHRNFGRVSALGPLGEVVKDSDPSHYNTFQEASVDIEKWTNDIDADNPPGPRLEPGAKVTWTYTITNTGEADLTNLRVEDSQLGLVGTKASLAAGDPPWVFTKTGTAIDEGQYRNVATVVADGPCETEARDDDPSHYYTECTEEPGIEIVKVTLGAGLEGDGLTIPIGDPVAWKYTVKNIGDKSLTIKTIWDSDPAVEMDYTPDTVLAPGAWLDCPSKGTHFAGAGPYENTGYVTAVSYCGQELAAEDPSSFEGVCVEDPDMTLDKVTVGGGLKGDGLSLLVGTPVSWEYTVTNTGADPLSNITVVDSQGVPVSCPLTTLAPMASMICTSGGSYFAQQGLYQNVGTATATTHCGNRLQRTDPSSYTGTCDDPGIELVKLVKDRDGNWVHASLEACRQSNQPDLRNRAVWWKFEVTNTGTTPLYNVAVTDPDIPLVSTSCQWAVVNANQTVSCGPFKKEFVSLFGDFDFKCHCRCNSATVSGQDTCDQQASDGDTSCYYK